MLGFAAVCALSLLTKGFIGLVFPFGFALGYLALTRRLRLLRHLSLLRDCLSDHRIPSRDDAGRTWTTGTAEGPNTRSKAADLRWV